jgi:hypothetical protein
VPEFVASFPYYSSKANRCSTLFFLFQNPKLVRLGVAKVTGYFILTSFLKNNFNSFFLPLTTNQSLQTTLLLFKPKPPLCP